ncbi:hypothetical protein L2E82_30177 [Cichorium intybus]|uniref:Uncharacterized protein n=1 Tax=Cichorium intybus TaxID=13427 RepID=A0ACB9D011_CICIN|nr:hypothetical protein L2E82_30177 [Cichorium intybus]
MKHFTDDLGEKLQAKKLVFLTKAEREQLDLKRRQDEFEEQKRRSEQLLLQSNPKLAERYLESKKPKKRVIKPSEKFRFSFDWETTKDTSIDMNILYQNPHEPRLLFGRGFRAGMDRREQKKLAAKTQKELRDEIRKKDGIEERPEETRLGRRMWHSLRM